MGVPLYAIIFCFNRVLFQYKLSNKIFELTFLKSWSEDAWVSKTVRVEVEDINVQAVFGESGVCVRVSGSTLTLLTDKNRSVQAPMSSCAVLDKTFAQRTPLMTWRLSFVDKVGMLQDVGMPSSEASWPLLKCGREPEGSDVSLWFAVMRQTFNKLSFEHYLPEFLTNLYAAAEDKTSELYSRLSSGLRAAVSSAPLHFFPVHCPESPEHPDGHWTLLVLEGLGNVRYYDTLAELNEVCLARAAVVLEALGVSTKPERSNRFLQQGVDCGWWVLRYAEAEVRKAAQEGWGAVKPVSSVTKNEMRACLSKAAENKNLEETRLKWLEEDRLAALKAEALRLTLDKRVGVSDRQAASLQTLQEQARQAAEVLLREGENLPNPPVFVEERKKCAAPLSFKVAAAKVAVSILGVEDVVAAKHSVSKKVEKKGELVVEVDDEPKGEEKVEGQKEVDEKVSQWLRPTKNK